MSPIPCPACGEPLPEGGAAACPSCALPLTGPLATRVWEIDQSIAALGAERPAVLAALRASGGQGSSVGQGAATPSQGEPAQTPTTVGRWTTQQTLLAVGVGLVLVASVVFLAVAWSLIGVTGQVLVMGALTGLAAYGALRLSRHGLASSAEALAVLSGGMLLLDVAAARSLGLADLDRVDLRTYGALSGAAAAVLLALLHRRDRNITSFAVLSLTAGSAAWASVVAFGDDSAPLAAGLALLGAGLFAGLHLHLPRPTGRVRTLASGPAAGWLSVAAAIAAGAALDAAEEPGLGAEGLACVALLGVVGVVGAVVVRRVVTARANRAGGVAPVTADWLARPLSGDWRAVGVVALAATVASPTAVASLALQAGAFGTAVLVSLTGLAAVALVASHPLGLGAAQRWAEGQTAAVVAALVAVAGAQDSEPALIVALTVTSVVAVAVAVLRPAYRLPSAGVAAVTAPWALGLAGGMVSPGAQVTALGVAALMLVGTAAWRSGQPEEMPLGVSHLVVSMLSVVLCFAHDWPYAAALLAAAWGVVGAGYAVLPRRRAAVVLGVGWLSAAVWTVLDEAGVEALEAYTLPCAALALAAGLWSRRGASETSWLTVGPAAAIALLPSALASFDDDPLARPLLAVVASAAVLALGARLRWQALVVIGATSAALVAVSQLGPYAVGLPRWLTLGVTGAVLLVLGARYERSRMEARRAAQWLSGLR
jgi:hypothetical protein